MTVVRVVLNPSHSPPPDKPQTPDQPLAHFIDRHNMQWPRGQARHCFLVDGEVGAFHFLVDDAVEFGIVGEALFINAADLIKASANHLPRHQIRNRGVVGEQGGDFEVFARVDQLDIVLRQRAGAAGRDSGRGWRAEIDVGIREGRIELASSDDHGRFQGEGGSGQGEGQQGGGNPAVPHHPIISAKCSLIRRTCLAAPLAS